MVARGSGGFEVAELNGGSTSGRFSYRVMARRKDTEEPKFDRVAPPNPLPADLHSSLYLPETAPTTLANIDSQ